ncbi:MAG: DUF4424 domain-containing protein [Alphaproteobacteria bacterium]|nr:DUF4424 domain-containing protein [Alphaproteobacteria bacterium]
MRIRPGLVGAALATALALAPPATANDSSATLGAGGIELRKNSAVTLAAEDLFVSREAVRVRYEFVNRTDRPVTTLVAFPLPVVDLAVYAEVDVNVPDADPVNFVGFSVTVDGRPVAARSEIKAERHGRDVTPLLREHKVPISAFAPDLREALFAVPKAKQEALVAAGVVDYQHEYGAVFPLWTVRTTFYWEQTFAPGRTTVIEHAYAPVVGTQFLSPYMVDDPSDDDRKWLDRFCGGAALRAELSRRLADAGKTGPVHLLADTIAYILTTANNWKGPIGRFRLTVDAGDPSNLLAACLPGLRRTGPSTWTLERRNYAPKSELDVLIVRSEPEK